MIIVVLIASLFDPISFLLALGGACFARRPWHVFILGLIVAVLTATIVAATTYGSSWGDWFIPRLLAATVHAWLGYAIVDLVRKKLARKRETQ